MSQKIKVEVECGDGVWTHHSTYDSWADAVDQADLAHGRIVVSDVDSLEFLEWSNGDDNYGGISFHEYFDASGVYRGADDDGVGPVFV